jgi:hypothetical protein
LIVGKNRLAKNPIQKASLNCYASSNECLKISNYNDVVAADA